MANTNTLSRTNPPYRLSVVTMAVIAINTATLSNGVWAEDIINLGVLTVTGEKMDKDIKETTTAVTVIKEEQYESGQTKDINELVTAAPNVTTGAFGTVNIRGANSAGAAVGSNAFMTGGSQRVTTVVDGVTDAWGGYNFNPTDIWDSKQVEVLRGPQSTSQGDNSIGGAVVLETNDPTFERESAIRAGLESYDNGNIKKNVAVMVSGPLIDDELAARLSIEKTQGDGYIDYVQADGESEDLSGSDSVNTRLKFLWTPSYMDGLTAKLTYVHRKNDGEYLNWVDSNSTSDNLLTVDGNSNNTRLQDSEVDTIGVDIDYRFNKTFTNKLQVSYNDYVASFDEYPGDTYLKSTDKKITIEDRLIFTPSDSRFSGFIGLYGTQTKTILDVDSGTSDAYDAEGTKTNIALFGEGTFQGSDAIALTAGGRIQNEKQVRTLSAWSNPLDQDTSETIFLPKVSATLAVSDSTTLGASITKGYNSGGAALQWWDGTASSWEYYTYEPETVWAYELSSKTRLNNGFTVNANIFYNDYTDYQAYTAYRLENVNSAYTYGAEVELVAPVTDNLQLRGSVGTLQTKVTSTDSDTSSWQGNELSYSPDLNISVGFTENLSTAWSIGGDSTYVSSYYSDMDNEDSYKAGGYITTNVNVQYVYKDLTVNGYINNLTNEDIVYLRRESTSSVGASRTIGISATYRL